MTFTITETMVASTYHGLSGVEAARRLKEYGLNARPKKARATWLKRLCGIFSEPMMLLLLATSVVYFLIGDAFEAFIIFLSVIPIGVIEFFQEQKTDQAITALDIMLAEECRVYRDGVLITLENKFLVPGDLIHMAAGDKLPADALLTVSPGLMVDEAILTGESVPVVKTMYQNVSAEAVAENKLFQGTLTTQGEGYAVVSATGGSTVYGKLGNLLASIEQQKTPLQAKIERLVKGVAIVAVLIASIIGVVEGLQHGLLRGLLGALTIAISIIPEEFPIVFSVFLIMGVWRMSKRNALVREMAMVETLGSATVICTDKTGTLTEGSMSLVKVYVPGALHSVAATDANLFRPLIHDALLALEQIPVDPIEIEMQRFAATIGMGPAAHYKEHELHKDGSFDAASKMVHHIWKGKSGHCFQYTAGAPEYLIAASVLSSAEQKVWLTEYQKLADDGFRVIAVAKTPCATTEVFLRQDFVMSGFLVMEDPLRAGVREAVGICTGAGIRVVMITGDNEFTARSIARQIGLPTVKTVLRGDELEKFSAGELRRAVQQTQVFARVKPDQKYLIVEALENNGEVVAMTGDGVNDAPALKKATIGIAMGKKGTEVARAAAGIVLLDDNFTTIVRAIEEGRRIYGNLRHAFVFLLSFHIPIVGLSLVPLLLKQDLFFLPIHIIFLELFCDPATVLGFERDKASRQVMHEPPRPISEPLINPRLWGQVAWQGFGIFGLCFGWYYVLGLVEHNVALGRTAAFSALVIAQLVTIISVRDWEQVKHNSFLTAILIMTVFILQLILFIPSWRTLFHFSPMSVSLYVSVLLSALSTPLLLKILFKRR